MDNDNQTDSFLYSEIKDLIEKSRQDVAVTVNSKLSILYWEIGNKINENVAPIDNADKYGKEIVATLRRQLQRDYGSAFSEKNLRRMMQFAKEFPDKNEVLILIKSLSWSHIKILIPVNDKLKRDFYIEMTKIEGWSTRTLQDRINSMLFERTAISKKPEKTIEHELEELKTNQKMSADLVFRDPYILDFLGLKDTYSEKDLESTILVELQKFIIELGTDFAFLSRQKRITIDKEDYYIDLLFFHRRLKCLVAIDLKLGKFEAGFKGQMELYLNYLHKYEMMEGENPPIGLILCASKNKEHIELLQLDKSNIKVAEYLTILPEMKLLESKLQKSIENARAKLSFNK